MAQTSRGGRFCLFSGKRTPVAIGSVYYCKSLVTGQQSLVKIETAFDHEVRRRFCIFAPRGYKLSASSIRNSKSAFICADHQLSGRVFHPGVAVTGRKPARARPKFLRHNRTFCLYTAKRVYLHAPALATGDGARRPMQRNPCYRNIKICQQRKKCINVCIMSRYLQRRVVKYFVNVPWDIGEFTDSLQTNLDIKEIKKLYPKFSGFYQKVQPDSIVVRYDSTFYSLFIPSNPMIYINGVKDQFFFK